MNSLIESHRNELNALFDEHFVDKAYLFGSALGAEFTSDSDLDFLIDFTDGLNPEVKGELWWSLLDSLRSMFKREIDLVISTSLKNPYFIKEVNKNKLLIYG